MQKKWPAWKRILGISLALAWSIQPSSSWAHGGGGTGGLECGLMQKEGYAIHLDVYVRSQGGMGNFKTYCQNVPTTGRMSLVLDLVTPQLRQIPLECTVTSSEGKVVAHFPAQVFSSGVASLDLDLPDRGRYMVDLTLVGKNGADGKPLVFRFPINVGMGVMWMGVAAGGLLVVAAGGVFFYRRMARRPRLAGPRGIEASAS
ncbi:hypothetical protein MAMC_00023 [Methylacidimicrobium cyclopophantes]|uniref:Uncharacterized protein n=2 Tax=Methylacidimicrobium cyclopophantes TaxID=1041766 RepID=A0A5E6MFM4_9BACT|nr:hypothetical protein MAMC_00023 [Methylacidimicrobium cyclopophantes]